MRWRTILCDPWKNPAYFGSWFVFPDNRSGIRSSRSGSQRLRARRECQRGLRLAAGTGRRGAARQTGASSWTAPSSGTQAHLLRSLRDYEAQPQSAPATPLPARRRATETATRASQSRPAPRPKTRSRRWHDQRISAGRITWTKLSARTRSRSDVGPLDSDNDGDNIVGCYGHRAAAQRGPGAPAPGVPR
jgi:hypothetical protein